MHVFLLYEECSVESESMNWCTTERRLNMEIREDLWEMEEYMDCFRIWWDGRS